MTILNNTESDGLVKLPMVLRFWGFYGPNVGRFVIAAFFAIIGFILIILSYFSCWYTWGFFIEDEDSTSEVELKSYLDEAVVETNVDGDEDHSRVDWNDSDLDSMGEIFTILRYVQIIMILLAIISLITVILIGFLPHISNKGFGVALCAISLIIANVGPILIVFVLPDAFHKDFRDLEDDFHHPGPWEFFWGSDSGSKYDNNNEPYDFEHEWHPSYGWYFSMIGGWFLFFAGIILYGGLVRDEEIPEIKKMREIRLQKHTPMLSQQINIHPNIQDGNTPVQTEVAHDQFQVPTQQLQLESMKIFCANCGREHLSTDKFCSSCGNTLSTSNRK